ncbi:hypothetical protein [Hymenobacter sp. YC55]|uniref:hypothetical protein n=1 Tax=Hymenobacter sp. YC55 TaxID=3034019 RepID=UPI0023F66376|nr:hypothetical protein [Hymenobacter sp. YC55]MDF7811320.1 hypothetical protein [Hymenobacter sp. YC55]
MNRTRWKEIIAINLIIGLIILLPFLPGPSYLSRLANTLFNLLQIGSFFGLILVPFGVFWALQLGRKESNKRNILPILLFTVPVLVFTLSMWGADSARRLSRNVAIKNAGELIDAIDRYKEKKHQYPATIVDLVPDYINGVPNPWIMGIAGYEYERKADTYNLVFIQNVLVGFNYEVVVYDPTKNHKAQGKLQTLYSTENSMWKYYIYD